MTYALTGRFLLWGLPYLMLSNSKTIIIHTMQFQTLLGNPHEIAESLPAAGLQEKSLKFIFKAGFGETVCRWLIKILLQKSYLTCTTSYPVGMHPHNDNISRFWLHVYDGPHPLGPIILFLFTIFSVTNISVSIKP